jgi:hypothetical protein
MQSVDTANRMPTLSLTFLELLDRTFRVYRENFSRFLLLAAMVAIPINLINGFLNIVSTNSLVTSSLSSRTQLSSDWGILCLIPVISLILVLVQVVVVDGLLTYMTSEYTFGRCVTIGEAYQAVRQRFSTLGCGMILLYVVVFAFAIPIALLGAVCFPVWAGFGLVAYIFIATFAYLAPVIVLENVNSSFGLNRAWWLGKSRFWTAFGVLFVVYLLVMIFTVIFNVLGQFLTTSLIDIRSTMTYQVVNLIFSTVVGIFVVPIMPIALTLLYYDTRARVEGLDLALMSLDSPQARPINIESPSPGPFFTSRDLVNVAALVGGAFALALVFGTAFTAIINQLAPGFSNLPR